MNQSPAEAVPEQIDHIIESIGEIRALLACSICDQVILEADLDPRDGYTIKRMWLGDCDGSKTIGVTYVVQHHLTDKDKEIFRPLVRAPIQVILRCITSCFLSKLIDLILDREESIRKAASKASGMLDHLIYRAGTAGE